MRYQTLRFTMFYKEEPKEESRQLLRALHALHALFQHFLFYVESAIANLDGLAVVTLYSSIFHVKSTDKKGRRPEKDFMSGRIEPSCFHRVK